MSRYNPSEIEPKWQDIWDKNQTYKADLSSDKPKYFAMSMFNYPSGAGIHIGHAMNYTISDIMARFRRQQGFESYHPVGWDAFGLPAENFAIKTGVSPQESMKRIIPDYHKQYKAMGWSNDWSKEIATHEPEYYKWTQWLFSQMYKAGLAYQDSRMQWWCEKDKTVLSNEQVIDGKCWRHDGPDDPLVEKREIKQWFFKITDYADELLEATDALDWTESVKTAQKNWIGKSQGAEVEFLVEGLDQKITVFTTRPDTLFGATFLVLAPEHDLVSKITSDDSREAVDAYIKEVAKKTEVERQASKEKTGVFTGNYATNPVNGQKIPIWIADYVLAGYGTGAIMAVPAHDERDFEFATEFGLPIQQVVAEHVYGTGRDTPRDEWETLHRPVVDAIITDGKGNYLLQIENEHHVHFVGGGIDDTDDSIEDGLRREVLEEVGFTNIISIKRASPFAAGTYARETKSRNQKVWGAFFEVVVDPSVVVDSEVEQGLHSVEWVKKDDVADRLTWSGHKKGWQDYLAEKTIDTDVREGLLVNSGAFDGLDTFDAREQIVKWLEGQGTGRSKTTYKLRDWSVSRQRYWGAPIPVILCDNCGPVLVPDDQLPVVLPELDDFAPSGDGRSALARATDWLKVDCPDCGGPAERETDTLDTYICSSWYMLRYIDPHNDQAPFSSEVANKWMPVDFYNGGDHATAHMMYARFITRFLSKQGLLNDPEPFKKFLFNGKVTAHDGQMFSKSKGNGVDPLEIINSGYGADALRTYLMFAAPLDQWIRWDSQGVPGTYRFLTRIWNLVQETDSLPSGDDSAELQRVVHPAIVKASRDIEDQKYNTAIATMMKLVNDLYDARNKKIGSSEDWKFALESLVMMVAPFAPHMAEELWHFMGHEDSVHVDNWPKWDEKYLVSDKIKIAVQVNGKLRGEIEVDADASEDDIKDQALAHENVAKFVGEQKPTKVIYVRGRLVSVVL